MPFERKATQHRRLRRPDGRGADGVVHIRHMPQVGDDPPAAVLDHMGLNGSQLELLHKDAGSFAAAGQTKADHAAAAVGRYFSASAW